MSLPTFTASTTAEEVADTFAEQIRGKNVLVTGTSINGIGFEAARVIAKYANLVVITGYNSERQAYALCLLQLSEDAIKKDVPSANIRQLVLDLTSLASVRKAAAEVNAYTEPLHVLVHNAASPGGPLKLTVDGLERQIAVGQFSPFLLTKLIAPKLLATHTASYTPRMVVVSSLGHMNGVMDFETMAHPDPAKFHDGLRYAVTKSCNILFAAEITKRSGGKINGFSLHPGAINTNIVQKEENRQALIDLGALKADGSINTEIMSWKTIPEGAATTVAAAFDTRLEAKPGAYLVDCVEANAQIAPHASNQENAEKLWTYSEDIAGEKFAF
ncbi:Short-chain dehydrogenase/reductase family protein [Mycena sanguinolenta]|uniref:Short-chain dehydrogenase/reductase family protein n=1 Tax=Mycena sanguinolenta TaxID=230812 RepID=A0A8H6XTX2_9AGAR|nr:Short-chain dehydrogenase/reductase family protein [Mycena sanguinolenta]